MTLTWVTEHSYIGTVLIYGTPVYGCRFMAGVDWQLEVQCCVCLDMI